MERYESYKDSGVKWIGEIPGHWEVRKMKYVFQERSQKGFPKLPLLAATQQYGVIKKDDYENRTVVATKGLETLKLVCKNDFVISLRSFEGGIEMSHEKGIISPAYTILTPKNIEPSYFRHLGKSPVFINLLKIMVTGIREGQNIDYNKLKTDFIPLPPKSEQTAIANYLDSVTSKIDEAISQQQKMIDLLNERKQIIIQNAVTKGLDPNVKMKDSGVEWIGEIPEDWKIDRFKNLFKTRTGVTFTKKQIVEYGERVISYGQIHSKDNYGTMVNSDLIRFIPSKLTKKKEKSLAYEGDFLFADTSEDLEGCGNNIFIDCKTPIYAGYHTILAKKNNNEIGQYLAYLFASRNWRWQVRSLVNGVKVFSITQTILKSVYVILPPVEEQLAIVHYLNIKVGNIEKIIKSIENYISLLQERKQIIINDVVTGKVKVV